jgi:hypothetical protein
MTSITSSASDSVSGLVSGSVSNAAAAIAASLAVEEAVADLHDRPLVVLVACGFVRDWEFLVDCDEAARVRPRPRPRLWDGLCRPSTSNCDRSRRALGFARRSRRCDCEVCFSCRRCVDCVVCCCRASSWPSSAFSTDGTVIFSLFRRRGRPRRLWTISRSWIRSRGSSIS